MNCSGSDRAISIPAAKVYNEPQPLTGDQPKANHCEDSKIRRPRMRGVCFPVDRRCRHGSATGAQSSGASGFGRSAHIFRGGLCATGPTTETRSAA
jgi:hypothetical protein